MRYFIILSICFLFFASNLSAQAGMNVYLGPSAVFTKDNIVTANGEGHYGYVIGANARLNSDNMYFLLSAEFGTFDLVSAKSLNFIGGEDLSYLKGKIGLGFDIAKLTRKITLRTKLQGSLMFVNDFNSEALKIDKLTSNGYTKINDGIAGIDTGLGISMGSFTFDFDYEYGLYNLYFEKKDTKLNFYALVIGVRF